MKNIKKGFTLVELIVVVSILAILSAVGFVSYSGYLSGIRDTNRISQLKSMEDGLVILQANSRLPLPSEYVEIKSNAKIISYQGYIGENILKRIDYSGEGLDPDDNNYFTYNLTYNRKNFSLMGFLENEENDMGLVHQGSTYANDYGLRFPFVRGDRVGTLLDEFNSPIQEVTSISNQGFIDIANPGTENFQVFLSNQEKFLATGNQLLQVNTNYDCKRIKDLDHLAGDGVYGIDPDGDGIKQNVYCDMTTDGGGWTYVTMLADTTTENLFSETNPGHNDFITSITSDISTKGKLSNVWLDDMNRDILLQCFSTEEEHKNYEIPVIIYDFLGTEKSNLTKSVKQNTEFSSKNLEVKWNNRKFTADMIYEESSSHDSVMGISTQSDRKEIFYIQEDQLAVYEYADVRGPAYGDPSNYTAFSDQVYCVSAIR